MAQNVSAKVVRFSQSARKHRIGKAHVLQVLGGHHQQAIIQIHQVQPGFAIEMAQFVPMNQMPLSLLSPRSTGFGLAQFGLDRLIRQSDS